MVPIIIGNMPLHGTTRLTAGKSPLNKVGYLTLPPRGAYSLLATLEGPPGGGQLKNILYKNVMNLGILLSKKIPIRISNRITDRYTPDPSGVKMGS